MDKTKVCLLRKLHQ